MNLENFMNYTFSIRGNTYKKDFITQGDLFDIESLKSIYSRGKYGEWIRWGTNVSIEMLDRVDMYSILSVLFPKLIKDLNVENFEDLSPIDVLEIKNEYNKQIREKFSNFMLMSMGLSIENDEEQESND